MVWKGKRRALSSGFMGAPYAKRQKTYQSNVLRGALRLASIQRKPELKCVDVNNSGASPAFNLISTTSSVSLLNACAVGAEVYQRVGRKIMMQSLHVRGWITQNQAKAAIPDFCRIMVVYDRQPALTGPPALLQSTDATGAVSSLSSDFTNIANFERFEVLADIQLDICGTSAVGGTASSTITDFKGEYRVNRYIKLKNLVAHYDSAGVGTAPVTGAIYLFTLGETPAANAMYTFNYVTRLRYYDH